MYTLTFNKIKNRQYNYIDLYVKLSLGPKCVVTGQAF